jgi:hypothetical protein
MARPAGVFEGGACAWPQEPVAQDDAGVDAVGDDAFLKLFVCVLMPQTEISRFMVWPQVGQVCKGSSEDFCKVSNEQQGFGISSFVSTGPYS